MEALPPIGRWWLRPCRRSWENLTTEGQSSFPVPVGQQAVVADADEAVRQDVEEKSAEKLFTRERHLPEAVVVGIVLPGEGHRFVVEAHQPRVGNGDAVGVARQVGEHLLGTAERRL